MTLSIQAVVLSGGSGTRLWPFSREAYPKQFLPLATDERTLFQETVSRVVEWGVDSNHVEILSPLVVCNDMHRYLVAEQLRQMGLEKCSILLEPVGRNTAPALTIAALHITHEGANPLLVVLPSDHYVKEIAHFQHAILEAAKIANEGYVVTFGIVPDRPETGFGYLLKGEPYNENMYALAGFTEKPDSATASSYLASGRYFWNSGMFVLQARTWLHEIEKYRPDILTACRIAYSNSHQEGDFVRIEKTLFSACPSDSIDYAVMEKVTLESDGTLKAMVLPLEVGWSDVGSWPALTDLKSRDAQDNVVIGDVFAKDTYRSLLYSQSRFLAVVGISDAVVIETPDAVLVAHKDCAQDVKAITDYLRKSSRSEYVYHRKVHRPWGDYESIDTGPRYQVKRLCIKPGASLSLQMHHHRAEHWIVVKGTAKITKGDTTFVLTENESTYIPIGTQHRLENPGVIPLEIIEVQSGSYLGEDDIVRFEDQYHRIHLTSTF